MSLALLKRHRKFPGASGGGGGGSALLTLVAGMATNSFKQLSLASEGTSFANGLSRTKANFDFNGSTWANDAAVDVAAMGGVGVLPSSGQATPWSFSGAAISDLDGKCTFWGGGHTDSGDSSIYTFDAQAAAANINLGGSGIAWALAQPSCMYIDAFTNARPSSATSPQGAIQAAPSTSTAANQNYWTMPNKNGIAMPVCRHSYHTSKYIPGTRNVLFGSGGAGFDSNGSTLTNSGWVFNDQSGAVSGPFQVGGSFPVGTNQQSGYAGWDPTSANPSVVAINPVDGLPYTTFNANFGWGLYSWSNPTSSSIGLSLIVKNSGLAPNSVTDAIIIPDPVNPGQTIFFEHRNQNTAGDGVWYAVTGLNGGTPTVATGTYGSGAVTTNGAPYLHLAYRKGLIWMTDGNHLFTINPNGSNNPATWTISQITSFTGDVPPDPTLIGSGDVPAWNYVASADAFVHVQQAGVRVYKPSDWAHP